MNRLVPGMAEADDILAGSAIIDFAVFLYCFNLSVQTGSNKIDNTIVLALTYSLFEMWNLLPITCQILVFLFHTYYQSRYFSMLN